jgi:hypothetical protein
MHMLLSEGNFFYLIKKYLSHAFRQSELNGRIISGRNLLGWEEDPSASITIVTTVLPGWSRQHLLWNVGTILVNCTTSQTRNCNLSILCNHNTKHNKLLRQRECVSVCVRACVSWFIYFIKFSEFICVWRRRAVWYIWTYPLNSQSSYRNFYSSLPKPQISYELFNSSSVTPGDLFFRHHCLEGTCGLNLQRRCE